MTFWQRLWRVQLAGLISLVAFSAFVAILFVIEGLLVSPRETDVIEVFLLVVAFGIFYGLFPAVLLGAPVYTAMVSRGRIRWLLLLTVVLIPGAAMLFHHRGLGIVAIVAGPSILFMTHKLHQRWSSHEN